MCVCALCTTPHPATSPVWTLEVYLYILICTYITISCLLHLLLLRSLLWIVQSSIGALPPNLKGCHSASGEITKNVRNKSCKSTNSPYNYQKESKAKPCVILWVILHYTSTSSLSFWGICLYCLHQKLLFETCHRYAILITHQRTT